MKIQAIKTIFILSLLFIIAAQVSAHRIAVIGAGPAGLACGYELQKQGFDVVVYEKEPVIGGRVYVSDTQIPVALGAVSLMENYQHTKQYVHELNIGNQLEKRALGKSMIQYNQKRYLLTKSLTLLKAFPNASLWDKARLLNLLGIMMVATKFSGYDLTRYPHLFHRINAGSFLSRMVSAPFKDDLLDPLLSFLLYYQSDQTSLATLIGYLIGGMQTRTEFFCQFHHITRALASKLTVHTNTPVTQITTDASGVQVTSARGIEQFDAVVCAAPAPHIQKIYTNPTPQQVTLLADVQYSSTIILAYQISHAVLPDLFFTVVPACESKKINCYARHEPNILIVSVPHEYATQIIGHTDQEIFDDIQAEVLKLAPELAGLTFMRPYALKRWHQAIPVYTPEHTTKVNKFWSDQQGVNNVYFCSDFMNSLWIEGCFISAKKIAGLITAKYH